MCCDCCTCVVLYRQCGVVRHFVLAASWLVKTVGHEMSFSLQHAFLMPFPGAFRVALSSKSDKRRTSRRVGAIALGRLKKAQSFFSSSVLSPLAGQINSNINCSRIDGSWSTLSKILSKRAGLTTMGRGIDESTGRGWGVGVDALIFFIAFLDKKPSPGRSNLCQVWRRES